MRALFLAITLAVLCLFLSACAGPSSHQQGPTTQTTPLQTQESDSLSAVDQIFISIKRAISNHYYVNRKLKVTRVYLNDFSSNINDDGLLKSYLEQYIRENIEGANQLAIGDFSGIGVDCLLDLGIEEIGNNLVNISASVMDSDSGKVVSRYSRVFPKAAFMTDDLRVFANHYDAERRLRQEYGNTRLLVFVDTRGKGFDEYEVNEMKFSSQYSGSGSGNLQYSNSENQSADVSGDYGYAGQQTSTMTSKTKLGRHMVYPTDIEVHVDGRPFTINSEGLAFDQMVKPGPHKVFITFREGSWDGVSRTELKGKRFSKAFMLDLAKDRTLRFDIAIGFENKQPSIESAHRDMTGTL